MKKRILLAHNFYQIGGGEHTVFENDMKMLQEFGHEVFTYTRTNDELKSSVLKLILLPFTTTWSFRTYFEVRKLIKEKNIDIVHCHNTFPLISPSVYYAARSMRVPVVQTVHNFRFLCPAGVFYCNGKVCEACREQNSFVPALKNKCYRNSTIQTAVLAAMLQIHRWAGTYRKINYIFLTEFNKSKFNKLINIDADTVFVKPNHVGCGAADKMPATQNKFIYFGRLEENKGIPFLLDVWKDMPEDYMLHIYGDGACRKACEDMANACGNIRFFGFQPQKTIFEDLKDAYGLIFTSELYEGYPMTIAESFAMGKPAVSTDIGNQCDVVSASGGGVVFRTGDKESFIRAIGEVVNHYEVYSQNAATYYQKFLSKEYDYEKLCEIYDRAQVF